MTSVDEGARERAAAGRLAARPATPTVELVAPPARGVDGRGLYALGLAARRDALFFVPAAYDARRPAPLVVMLHGAGGEGERTMASARALADAAGVVLLVPPSRGPTWDVLLGAYGSDVQFVDAALAAAFARCAVDPARVALGGFSDGASYALSLGLTNGDLFTHVIAYAPGFMAPATRVGRPACYVAHGTRDAVLPIDRCSRRLVPQLRREGYDVTYREFDGPHVVPPEVAAESYAWLTGRGSGGP
jgi:predicted esterase